MIQVSAREFRHRLRSYIERVEAGEGFEVTVHGRPVGRFVPLDPSLTPLERLIAEGKVTPARIPNAGPLPPPHPAIPGRPTATEELLAERRSDPR
jgi:prevent-host-death family protein